MRSIDLNCDLGEYEVLSEGETDARIMPFISSCNIACGGHAGNQAVIKQTIACAIEHQVSIGAHPSYPDRTHYGRRVLAISAAELTASLRQQILTIKTAAAAQNTPLQHVKPHGALYNQAAIDASLAALIAAVVAEIDPKLALFGLAHSQVEKAAEQAGLKFVAEGFADRAYTAEQTLVPRNQTGACIESTDAQLQQVLSLLNHNEVMSISGQRIHLKVDTICLHGDHPKAIQAAETLNQGLKDAGFMIEAIN